MEDQEGETAARAKIRIRTTDYHFPYGLYTAYLVVEAKIIIPSDTEANDN